MQFWTTELYAVVVIAVIGLILLSFLSAWLYTSKGFVATRTRGDFTYTSIEKQYLGGKRNKLFPMLAVILAMAGAIGILYFAQELWANPLFVDNYDINLMFIFAVFASFMMFITFAIAGLNYWAKQRMEVVRR